LQCKTLIAAARVPGEKVSSIEPGDFECPEQK
jgi:hypothetical protein